VSIFTAQQWQQDSARTFYFFSHSKISKLLGSIRQSQTLQKAYMFTYVMYKRHKPITHVGNYVRFVPSIDDSFFSFPVFTKVYSIDL
jgi:hypothetical protein